MDNKLLVHLQNEWAVQALVLLSLLLQVFLLLFASTRRHNVSTVRRLLLWLAYQLSDSTALFTLGHMAISSRPHKEQPLMVFWASFLLVHLGGQDAMTAYSFDDIRLSMRHLQTLIVQVMGASYVLYKYMPSSEPLLMASTGLIFSVGILRYGERIWALRSAFASFWSSVEKTDDNGQETKRGRLLCYVLDTRYSMDSESVLMGAHGLYGVCIGPYMDLQKGLHLYASEAMTAFNMQGRLYNLIEMELSLLYDTLYTKATVIPTWHGYCIRITALVATVAAFLMFQLSLSTKDGENRKDITVTYVLLVGALLMEMASLVSAVGSTWTCVLLLRQSYLTSYRSTWLWLHHEILSLRRLVRASRHRRWSGCVGQYNLLQSCAHDAARKPACVTAAAMRIAATLGLEQTAWNWWTVLRHSQIARLSNSTKELVLWKILALARAGAEETGSLRGMHTLQEFRLHDCVGWSIQENGFEDSIIAWHLATEMCLLSEDRSNVNEANLREAIRVLSNYLMFLLVLRPEVLPGPVRLNRYIQARDDLLNLMMQRVSGATDSPQEILEWSLRRGLHHAHLNSRVDKYYDIGVELARQLYDQHTQLEVIFGVWVEMLCYVANQCSRESHARQLSSGGELITIVWLMSRHAKLCAFTETHEVFT